jgi:hypothetical protein
LFVDPIADIAVLGEPDDQDCFEEWRAYKALVDQAFAFSIGECAVLQRA